MRERTTWKRDEVQKRVSSLSKTADPYTMNQDHKQPSHEKYLTGDPSTWAEDVHPSSGTWEAEYKGGEVKRNEIGMPEMRGDTFNHKEKTASQEVLLKKANLCVKVARMMLRNAEEAVVEDQALAFMHIPDSDLIATHDRLAAVKVAEEQEEKEEAQDKQAGEMPPQFKENAEAKKEESEKSDDSQQKQAGEMPPQFKENAEAKKEESEKSDDSQQKQATGKTADQQMMAQMQQMMAQLQQQMQQLAGQQAPVAPVQEQVPEAKQADDIDQMLAETDCAVDEGGVQMDAPEMSMEEDVLGPEDEVLRDLFANDESDAAQQVQQQGQDKQAFVRTASTRTVGTKPAGVSRIGGVASTKSNDVDRLSGLWNSAPDVSEAFGMKR